LVELGLAHLDFHLKKIELMPRQLRVQMLQFQHELLVTPRLARLPLQRPDLPFDLAIKSATRSRFCSVASSLRNASFFCVLNW